MTVRVGINGFGRIGRQSLKAIIERAPDVEVVAVNDLVDTPTNALLFKHDSTYGAYHGHRRAHRRRPGHRRPRDQGAAGQGPGAAAVGRPRRRRRPRVAPASSPTPTRPRRTSTTGAKKVIICAPAKGEDITIVLGVNEEQVRPREARHHHNACCTTNCLAPAAKVVHDACSASSAA